eukprot:scaffold40426_cov21-Cyclotella_meneghiniana.AAC.1
MAADGGNRFNITLFTYNGAEGEVIPRHVTHVRVANNVTFVRPRAFYRHPNIVEVICHEFVEEIGACAFARCPSLRLVIIRGVKIAERRAFYNCRALTVAMCGKLELIGEGAFSGCKSLRSINLPSVRVVERSCENLKHVDLVEGEELRETIAALYMERWRNDMSEEINSINQNLPNAASGWSCDIEMIHDPGEKAFAIRRWIRSLLDKMIHYQTVGTLPNGYSRTSPLPRIPSSKGRVPQGRQLPGLQNSHPSIAAPIC